jgi:hypothetical protein
MGNLQEEPKQETLEEAAYRLSAEKFEPKHIGFMLGVIEGAKWQAKRMYSDEPKPTIKQVDYVAKKQERMYSEEDLKNAFESAREFNSLDGVVDVHIVLPIGGDMSDLQPLHFTFEEWFEQFKKK